MYKTSSSAYLWYLLNFLMRVRKQLRVHRLTIIMSRLLARWSGRTRLLTSSSGIPSNLSCFFLSLYVFARFLASASSALREEKRMNTEGLIIIRLDSFMLCHTIQREKGVQVFLSIGREHGGLFPCPLFVEPATSGSRVLDSLPLQCLDSWHRNAMLRFVLAENSYWIRANNTRMNKLGISRDMYKATVDAIYACNIFKK